MTPSHLGYQKLCVGYYVSVFRGPSGYQRLEICFQHCLSTLITWSTVLYTPLQIGQEAIMYSNTSLILQVQYRYISASIRHCIYIKGSVLYRDISIVSILWLYNTYRIIHFSYTILQMIHFSLNLGYFGHLSTKIPMKFVNIPSFLGLKPDKMYCWYISNTALCVSWYVSYHLK